MLAKAHIAVGMAAAFSIVRPGTVAEALPVIAGGALGCLICDLDCENKSEKSDSSHWRVVMVLVATAALIEDYLLDAGMWRSLGYSGNYLMDLLGQNRDALSGASGQIGTYLWFAGLAGFVITCVFASGSGHRGFSHSLLAMALETICLWLIFPAVTVPFVIAFASHVLLDIMNKRSVRLLYPSKRGFCLGWFYADKLANKLVTAGGTAWMIAAIIMCLRSDL
ncbi:MAG: metal-dependent hydrolase [Mogibacterium sp.]|nr:metal-dependent hydrolase [Mogibacterium sp.]